MTPENLKFDEKGLLPVITQDYATKEVLMLAYANREAIEKTLETGKVHYYSRSRQTLWLKGETSGHFQHVRKIYYDCDCDAILILAEQEGAACHTGNKSCFYRSIETKETIEGTEKDMDKTNVLDQIYDVIMERKNHPHEGSYTNYLFDKGIDKMLKKVGEEAAEVIIAAKNPSQSELTYEIADLLYHVSVVMAERGLTWEDIYGELKNRRK